MKYSSIAVTVEAFRLPEEGTTEFHEWARANNFVCWTSSHHGMDVTTNAGLVMAGEGDWIVKLPDGSFTVFNNEEFGESFRPLDAVDADDGALFRWLFARMTTAIELQRQGTPAQDAQVIALMEKFEQRGMAGPMNMDDVRAIFKEIGA